MTDLWENVHAEEGRISKGVRTCDTCRCEVPILSIHQQIISETGSVIRLSYEGARHYYWPWFGIQRI